MVNNSKIIYISLIISLIALAISIGGNVISVTNINSINNNGKTNRNLIANTDLELCTSLYKQIYNAEKQTIKIATVGYYKKLLPGQPEATYLALVANAKRGAKIEEKNFNPKKCNNLPAVKVFLNK